MHILIKIEKTRVASKIILTGGCKVKKNLRLKVILAINRCIVKNNMMIVSMIKEALKESSEEYYSKWYEHRTMKDFTFSTKANDLEVEADRFIKSDEVDLVISTYTYETLIVLYNAFLQKNKYRYKDIDIEIKKIRIIEQDSIQNDVAIFNTMSPIYIKNAKGKSVVYSDVEFSKELNYICNIILTEIRGFGLKQELIYKNINMKEVVVRMDHSKFEKESYYAASKGRFALIGDSTDLNDLLKTGIGFNRSLGLGCIYAIQ